MKPQSAWIGLLLLGFGLVGCDQGRKNPPNVPVTLFHAAPSQGTLSFIRVQVRESTLEYQQSATGSWDADTYTFHVDLAPIGSDPERLLSFTRELVAENEYKFIAAERAGQLEVIVLEAPVFSGGGGNLQITPIHLAETLGPVDLFLEPPGSDLAAATPLASLNFAQSGAPSPIAAGDYEVSLTEAGNPTNVILASNTFSLPVGQTVLFSIVEGANQGFAPVAVVASGGGDLRLVDRNLQSAVRAINAVADRGAVDVGFDSELAPPLIPDLAYGAVSDHVLIAEGTHNLTVAPAGNPGSIILDAEFVANGGRFGTWLVAGNQGNLFSEFLLEDNRVLAGKAKVNVYNGAVGFAPIDVYIAEPGTDLDTVAPTAQLTTGTSRTGLTISPGDYELTVEETGVGTVLAGPIAITIAAGGNYSILATDTLAGATVDIALFDDFN